MVHRPKTGIKYGLQTTEYRLQTGFKKVVRRVKN